jgi:hypothetical protein
MDTLTDTSKRHARPRHARPLACLAGAAVVSIVTVPVTAAHASVTASDAVCATAFNVYAAPASQLSRCGISTYPRQATHALSDGGTQYDYSVNGARMTYRIPPFGWRATTASAAQLQEYGLPPRPTNAAALKAWTKMMGNLHFVVPPAALASIQANVDVLYYDDPTNTYPDIDAAGYVARTGVNDVEGIWYEPDAYTSRCDPSDAAVYWSGMGGFSYGDTALEASGTGQGVPGLGNNQGFVQYSPINSGMVPQNITATDGKEFESWVIVDPSTPVSFDFGLYNTYTGQVVTVFEPLSVGADDESSADFIVSRAETNYLPTFDALKNFETLTYAGATAEVRTTTSPLGSLSPQAFNMDDKAKTLLAATGSLYNSGYSFKVVQHTCD